MKIWPAQFVLLSFVSATLSDIPNEILVGNILCRLLPLATARFGQTCNAYWPMAQRSILARFGDGDRLDIELLHGGLARDECENEKTAIKTLILKNIPPLTTKGLEAAENYELTKLALFTDDQIEMSKAISKDFPKLSRVFLEQRGCKFHLSTTIMDNLDEELFLDIIPFVKSIDSTVKNMVIYRFSPHTALKLLPFSKNLDVTMAYSDLGNLNGELRIYKPIHLAFAVCHANEHNMDQTLRLLENSHGIVTLSDYLTNWIKFPHLKPVVMYLLKRGEINPWPRDILRVRFSEIDQPMEYYEALQGTEFVKSIEGFLISFDDSIVGFLKTIPNDVAPMHVFEVAVLKGYKTTLLEAIIGIEGFQYDLYLIAFSTKMKIPKYLIMKMLSKPSTGLGEMSSLVGFTAELEVDVFAEFTRNLTADIPQNSDFLPNIYATLFDMIPSNFAALEYFRVSFESFKNSLLLRSYLLCAKMFDRFPDAIKIRQELYKLTLQHGFALQWGYQDHYWNTLAREEINFFFDGIDTEVLVKYVSEAPKNRIFMKSSCWIAFNNIAQRPGGLDLLEEALAADNVTFDLLNFILEYPNGDFSVIDENMVRKRHFLNLREIARYTVHVCTTEKANLLLEYVRPKLCPVLFQFYFEDPDLF